MNILALKDTPTPGDPQVSTLKIDIVISLMCLLTLCVMFFTLRLPCQVYKLVKCTDLPMLSAVILLCLSAICNT